ncbi:MAG: GNAT family N-acetyltransferase [Magnetospirillum sp.]|nr:GNAT family N-acetyltransferase [Magnetospirillum sp.]
MAAEAVTFRPLAIADAPALAALLAAHLPAYMRGFFPFAFDARIIAALLAEAHADRYWAIEVEDTVAGLVMLRGFDSGYARPSFGVAVAEAHAGAGLGRAALNHALDWCRRNGVAEVMLKVADDNAPALRLYQQAGFRPGERCPQTGQRIFTLSLAGT